jgi:hypothetical protein
MIDRNNMPGYTYLIRRPHPRIERINDTDDAPLAEQTVQLPGE